jgi:hypothetical protein
MSASANRWRLCGAKVHTDRSGTCINAVLDELFAYRLQINDDLTRLYLMHRAAFYGLDCGHVNPCQL